MGGDSHLKPNYEKNTFNKVDRLVGRRGGVKVTLLYSPVLVLILKVWPLFGKMSKGHEEE